MSLKSERKKQIKVEKQATAAVLPPPSPSSPRKWYAEDAAEFVEEHRKQCTDPTCDNQAVSFSLQGVKLVPMLYPQKLNEIFFAVYGTGADEDYQPFMSLQLANPEDIRASFDEKGNLKRDCLCDHDGEPIILAFTCHNEGAVIAVEPDGVVTIRCKSCGGRLGSIGFPKELKLAPRPQAEYPSLFCHKHGIQPGYIVCVHVLNGDKPPVYLRAADAEDFGAIWCEDCHNLTEDEYRDRFITICQSSLDERSNGQLRRLLADTGQSLYVPTSTVLNAPVASASVN